MVASPVGERADAVEMGHFFFGNANRGQWAESLYVGVPVAGGGPPPALPGRGPPAPPPPRRPPPPPPPRRFCGPPVIFSPFGPLLLGVPSPPKPLGAASLS